MHSIKHSVSLTMMKPKDEIEFHDFTEVYGIDAFESKRSNVMAMFPEIDTPCENPSAPGGQCHFNAVSLEPTKCLYCHKLTG